MPGYGMKKKPMMKHGGKVHRKKYGHGGGAVSYTHLTLPTILRV